MFVTAGAKNTGFAIAEKFASEGYDVAVSSRSLEDALAAEKKLSEKYGVKVKGYSLEVTDTENIKEVFSQIKKDFGTLEVFVANAANLGVDMGFLDVTPQQYSEVVDVNLKGTFFCCQNAAHIMKEQNKGAIVLVSSVHSHGCIWGRSLYSASKSGVNGLGRAMAIELAPYNIRANTIIAGAIRTDRWDNTTEEQRAARRKNWPLGIESTGEDIANGVFYLGTDMSKTVTGTELTIDSGLSASILPYNGGKK